MQKQIFRIQLGQVEQVLLQPKKGCPGLYDCRRQDTTLLCGVYYNADRNWLISNGRALMINDELVITDEKGVSWTTCQELAEDFSHHFDELW